MNAGGADPARDRILGRVRDALARSGAARDEAVARMNAEAYVAAHAQGPRPRTPDDLVARFMRRATDMESTVERVAASHSVPEAVARYLDTTQVAKEATGVCWPELAALGWSEAGLSIESRPTVGHDALGITGCFCAIAETGTLVFLTGTETPTGTFLLPETHVAIVRPDQIVAAMEDAFARIRAERGQLPRAVNLVSGPSRTGDIEQTIVLGAHGPRRLHIVLVG